MDGVKNSDMTFRQGVSGAKEYSQNIKENNQVQVVREQRKEIKSLSEVKPQNLEKAVEKEVEKLNESMELIQKQFKYKVHKDTNRVMVQVIDKETSEVLREIPPEKILDMVAKIEEMIGLIVDEKI